MMRQALISLVSVFALAPVATAQTIEPATAVAPISVDSVFTLLKSGGLVMVFRHAHTDRSRMESHDFSLTDRSTQRNLSEQGVQQATHIGHRVLGLAIPVSEVLASPMFRTLESARYAFGRADTTELLRSRGTSAEARALLTVPVPGGGNRVLMTHNAFLHRHLGPLGFGQIGEGDAVIIRPLGDRFEAVGRIRVNEWGEH
jgi:phosphohistidine phosphatase SixA